MKKCAFQSVIEIRGVNPFIGVSRTCAHALKSGWRKPLPVRMRIDGAPAEGCCTNMMPAGDGSFYLYLNGEVRAEAGAGVGDRVRVEIEFDAQYRGGPQNPMPAWFRNALKGNAQAEKNWERLIPSRKKEVLRSFARLKSQEARERNLARAMEALSGKTVRFMGRTWTAGA